MFKPKLTVELTDEFTGPYFKLIIILQRHCQFYVQASSRSSSLLSLCLLLSSLSTSVLRRSLSVSLLNFFLRISYLQPPSSFSASLPTSSSLFNPTHHLPPPHSPHHLPPPNPSLPLKLLPSGQISYFPPTSNTKFNLSSLKRQLAANLIRVCHLISSQNQTKPSFFNPKQKHHSPLPHQIKLPTSELSTTIIYLLQIDRRVR